MNNHEERLLGFVTNIKATLRTRIALKVAGVLTGFSVTLKDNCTDDRGRSLKVYWPDYRALYVTPHGDLSKFWKIADFLRGR